MKSKNNIQKFSKGFTLAELLVAMAITIVLVSITVSLTATALDAWRGARNEVRAARQGKTMLDFLGRDLESLISRKGGTAEWLRVVSDTDPIGPSRQPSPNSSRMIFFTSASDRYNGNVGDDEIDMGGSVCLVGYQLEYGDPIFGETENINAATFVLYRDLVDPDETFQRYIGSEDLEQDYRRENSGGTANASDYICENIFEMTVTFVVEFVDETEGLTTIRLPVMATSAVTGVIRDFALTGKGLEADSNENNPYASGRIVSVDLSVTVLSDTGLRILKNSPFQDEERKSRFLSENSYRYTKSINIPQP